MDTTIWLFILGICCALIGGMAVLILNSIKIDIKDVKTALMVIPNLDRRVTVLETQIVICKYHHRLEDQTGA